MQPQNQTTIEALHGKIPDLNNVFTKLAFLSPDKTGTQFGARFVPVKDKTGAVVSLTAEIDCVSVADDKILSTKTFPISVTDPTVHFDQPSASHPADWDSQAADSVIAWAKKAAPDRALKIEALTF